MSAQATKKPNANRLAIQMVVALAAGIIVGLIFMAIRENIDPSTWATINNILFQDITAEGAESAIGIFYIGGQLFVRALQVVIVPMVFTSIAMAIGTVSDARTLGRISTQDPFMVFDVDGGRPAAGVGGRDGRLRHGVVQRQPRRAFDLVRFDLLQPAAGLPEHRPQQHRVGLQLQHRSPGDCLPGCSNRAVHEQAGL